jgi:hypothetical protein
MKYKYQLIILGTLDSLADELIDLFYLKIEELQLRKDSFVIIKEGNFAGDYNGNQPAFAFYFGDEYGNFKDIAIVDTLIKDGSLILPIFYKSFSNEIPKVLENQNGLKYNKSQKDKIVDLALESFGKLRNTRKVFISYMRNESTSIAIQLYEALERNNFDVFLDTHSIKQGEPFQEELWHRMSDCDVIVLLNTPEFFTRHWCKEEFAEAGAKQIGVIQLIWPNHAMDNTSEVCFPFQLSKSDFVDENYDDKDKSKFTDEYILELVQEVESVRARNLASRQDGLITEFSNLAVKHGKKVNVQPERFITEELGSKKRRIFIPLIGIPQSLDCNQSAELKKEITDFEIESIHLLYDNIRIRQKWIKHLDWLNEYLDVKTLKKQDFDTWLKNN